MKNFKVFLALLAMSVCGFGVSAQFNSIRVTVPTLNKVAVINADGINLRQSPNTSSAKLVEVGAGDFMSIGFGLRPESRYESVTPCRLTRGTIVPVLAERGEWIQIAAYDNEPWIMKKFCTIKNFTDLNITAPNIRYAEVPPMYGPAGLSDIFFNFEINEMDGNKLFIGKKINNVVYGKSFWFSCSKDESLPKTGIVCDVSDGFNIRYGANVPTVQPGSADWLATVDFSRLPEAKVREIISKAALLAVHVPDVAIYLTINGNLEVWRFDPDNVSAPKTTITIP